MPGPDRSKFERIYNAALEHQPEARAEFLRAECAGDDELRREVESLLGYDGAGLSQMDEPPRVGLPAGSRLGPYEIAGWAGTGGMGEVYKARDTRLNRTVAIKVLPGHLSANADFRLRLQREAKAVSALSHAHICTLYDVGHQNGIDYLVMEYLDGETLASRLAKGTLPLKDVLRYGVEIAEALAAAHRRGILHRDLKPGNIMLTKSGAKLLDFGLAKVAPVGGDAPDAVSETELTGIGTLLGTLPYMSPEQVQGKPVDFRSDIFSFGAVLYEMASEHAPFAADSRAGVIAAILDREPEPPSKVNAQIPPALDKLIQSCLIKGREDRQQSMHDAAQTLGWIEAGAFPRIDSSRLSPPKTGVRTIALVLVVFTVGVLAGFAVWRSLTRGPESRPLVQLDLDVGEEVLQLAISPDASRIIYAARSGLHVRQLDQVKITTLYGAPDVSYPFFSPDGKWIGFFAGGKLQKISLDGGSPVVLCDAPAGRGGSWGQDGEIVAALDSGGGLFKLSAYGGTPQPLTDLAAETNGVTTHRWPAGLPDARGVLFVAQTMGGKGNWLRVAAHRSTAPKTLVENATAGRYMAGGYLLYHQAGTVYGAEIDLRALQLIGPGIPLAEEVAYDVTFGAAFDVSSSGTMAYLRGASESNFTVSWLDSSGHMEPIIMNPAGYLAPRISPDGKRIALELHQDRQRDVWTYDLVRESLTRLTFDSEFQSSPIWTPDGRFVAFGSRGTLAWVRADGSGVVDHQAVEVAYPLPMSFSPDGKWLAFTDGYLLKAPVDRANGSLRLGPVQGLHKRAATGSGSAISPDGRWVAYDSAESGRQEVYVVPFSPTDPKLPAKWQVSNEGGEQPVWSRAGHELFYRSLERRVMAARYTTNADLFLPQKPRTWAQQQLANVGLYSTFDVAPDGKRVAAVFESPSTRPDTHLRVLLNVTDELRRRTAAGR